MEKTIPRRRLVELLSTLPLIGLGAANFFAKRKYYDIDLSQAKESTQAKASKKETNLSLEKLSPQSGAAFQSSLSQLSQVYEEAYYRSHTELYTTTDSEGHVSVETRTVWEWEEPCNVPDHNTIFGWRDAQKFFSGKVNYLHRPLIDGEKIHLITVDEKDAAGIGVGLLGALMYGGEIAALLGYEEIIASLKDAGYGSYYNSYRRTLAEKVERTNTPEQMSRRSWLKCAAALVGAGAAGAVTCHNQEQNESGKDELEQKIAEITQHQRIGPAESFQRYFGSYPLMEQDRIKSYINTANETLLSGVKEQKVAIAFQKVAETGAQYQADIGAFFSSDSFNDLTSVTNYGLMTRKLEEISAERGTQAKLGLLYEGLAVGGAMALVLIPAEIINSRMAGKKVSTRF